MGRLAMAWIVGTLVLGTGCSGGEEGGQGGGLDSGGSSGSSGKGGSAGTAIILGGTSGGGGTSGSSTSGSSNGGSSPGGSGGLMPCTCENPSDGCARVAVRSGADVSNQPWTLWPDEADGRGTLIVSAYSSTGGSYFVWVGVPDADFSRLGNVYTVDLTCIQSGMQFF